jgi:GxxExxY protein
MRARATEQRQEKDGTIGKVTSSVRRPGRSNAMVQDVEVPAQLTHRILGSAIEVHRALGPGLLENAYRACLVHALKADGLNVAAEVPIPVHFRGVELDSCYRADIVVEGKVLLELKVVSELQPVHVMQVLTYLRLAHLPLGLLINFNVPMLMKGVRRVISSHGHAATHRRDHV